MAKPKRDREEKTMVVTAEFPTRSALMKEPYLIVITGNLSGKTVHLSKTKETFIGRDPTCDIMFESNECSRRHARIFVTPSATIVIEDLESTNGTFINGRRIEGPTELKDGDRINIGNAAMLKFSLQDAIEERFQSNLYESATRDPLTGIFNKKYFLEHIEREFRRFQREDSPVTLIMFDLDHFKNVNDTYGHQAGDEVLKTVTKVVASAIRKETIFARYGGEEFAVILTNSTLDQAQVLAERLRELVANSIIPLSGQSIQVTVSLGLAQTTKAMTASSQLIEFADQALYNAKHSGRNRVCLYSEATGS